VNAVADAGWSFDSWSGDHSGTANPDTITITGDMSVTATFIQSQRTISGTVTLAGIGLADVQMSDLPGDPCTDGSGFYTATVDAGFSGVVTPIKAGYTFEPSSRTYSNVTEDQVNQDYKAMPAENFNDNRRSAMWRGFIEDYDKTWVVEEDTRLNVGGSGEGLTIAVGHWKMNDNAASKVVIDSTGRGNHGTAKRNTDVLHTTGKIDGALTFDVASGDGVDVGPVIGTGAYTKVAWIKRQDTTKEYNTIIASDTSAHKFWAPRYRQFKLSAGHNSSWLIVEDSTGIAADVWYHVAVTFDPDVDSGTMVLYKDGVPVDTATSVPAPGSSNKTYIGRYGGGEYFNGAIDNVMIFDRALTAGEIEALYNSGNGTETLPIESNPLVALYTANGWHFDANENFAVEVDFHYSGVSERDSWAGMTIENDTQYISISVGSDGNESYYYYETIVDSNTVLEKELRTQDDGTLYVSYDATLNNVYLSHTGYGSGNAYTWQTITDPLQIQWSSPVDVAVGGGTDVAALGSGAAYLDDFEMSTAELLGWPPVGDVDGNGFIEWEDLVIICDNWLVTGPDVPGDIHKDENDTVDFLDYADVVYGW